MKTSLAIAAKEPNGKKCQKTITDVNPNADGNALKTWAQGLNDLTTNTYIGTTKINIDNLMEEESGGSGSVNPLPAPNIIAYGWGDNTDKPALLVTLEVADAAASWSGVTNWSTFGFVTDSTGNLNVTGTPANAAAIVTKATTVDNFYCGVTAGPNLSAPTNVKNAVAALQNPAFWVVSFSFPDLTSADCKGEFTFVLNATDTHSSVTVTLNFTGLNV